MVQNIILALLLLFTMSCDSDNTDSRDGKKYRVIKIGEQIWMAENLNYNAEGSECYGKDPVNCQKYGRLYNWKTAKTVCPSGWHLPSNDEWQTLVSLTGGKNLKASRGWNGAGYSQDTYSFSALPGGYGIPDGYFLNVGNIGYWWTSTEDNGDYAYARDMVYDDETAYYNDNDKNNLYSVRCLHDK